MTGRPSEARRPRDPRRFWIRVPASTSNLGPGFDTLGMAVDRFLEVTWEGGGGDLEVTRSGTLEEARWPREQDLVVQVARDTTGAISPRDHELPGTPPAEAAPLSGRLHLHSDIPLGRGLGSSAAARVAGAILRRLLTGKVVDRQDILREGAVREGHPDNAAPAILGGLVAARLDLDGRVWAAPLPLSSRLGWVFAMPGVGLDTTRARAALPDRLPHGAAVRNAARLALLIPALAAGDGPAVGRAMVDELHVPYRLPLIPGAAEAVEAAGEAGAWGATLSGAGSGLIAAVPPGSEAAVGEAMRRQFEAHPAAQGGHWIALRPWTAGAQWGSGSLRPRGPERFATSPG